jgi:RNA polymerase sigma-70 factor (ECF subfamily)
MENDKRHIDVDFLDSNSILDYYSKESVDKSFPLLDQLKSALKKLKKEEQDILLLRAQNFTYGEIRKMLDPEKKENHLKVIHLRAKRKLAEIMSSQSFQNNKNHGNNE